MSSDTAPDFVVTTARGHGPVAPGSFRVVVEANSELTIEDFADLERARRYAEDAASESDGSGGSPYVYVFDDKLEFLGRGLHYAARRAAGPHGVLRLRWLRWQGAALIAVALAVLPVAIWVSSYWGFVSGAAGLVGLALLAAGYSGANPEK